MFTKESYGLLFFRKRENFSLRIEYQRVNWRSLSHQSKEGKENVAVESVGFIHTIYERLSSIDKCKVYVANPNKGLVP
jgi:hypothetical protein